MEDAFKKELSVPDEASVLERILRKNVKGPNLATVKDFLRFHAATSEGKIKDEITSDSLYTFTKWFFAGFSCITDTTTNADNRSEVAKCKHTSPYLPS
jgi:hypothetical protein